jgi:DNA-binding response OmpR family regulator
MGQLVVVIEDDVDVLGIVRDALEADGYAVIPISHPTMVNTLDHDVCPDLFLIDVMLPQRSGIEVAQELRRKAFGSSPMIAMSASRLLAGAASAAGIFDDVMDKPFDLAQLLECVQLYAPAVPEC